METLIKDKEEFVGLLTKQIAKGHELLNLEVVFDMIFSLIELLVCLIIQ